MKKLIIVIVALFFTSILGFTQTFSREGIGSVDLPSGFESRNGGNNYQNFEDRNLNVNVKISVHPSTASFDNIYSSDKGTWKVDDSNTTKATYDSKSREYVFTNYSSGISIITMCFRGYKENKYCVQISQPAKDVSKNSSLTERILKSYTYYK